jgi:hypothetical protein
MRKYRYSKAHFPARPPVDSAATLPRYVPGLAGIRVSGPNSPERGIAPDDSVVSIAPADAYRRLGQASHAPRFRCHSALWGVTAPRLDASGFWSRTRLSLLSP